MQVDWLSHGELLRMHIQLVGGRRRTSGGARRWGRHRRGRHAVCADAWWSTVVVKRRGDRTEGLVWTEKVSEMMKEY